MIFLIIGLYFLLSLILAVVYTHFAARNAKMSAHMEKRRTEDFMHAFRLMSDLTRHEQARNSSASGACESKRQATQHQEADAGAGAEEGDEEQHIRGVPSGWFRPSLDLSCAGIPSYPAS